MDISNEDIQLGYGVRATFGAMIDSLGSDAHAAPVGA